MISAAAAKVNIRHHEHVGKADIKVEAHPRLLMDLEVK